MVLVMWVLALEGSGDTGDKMSESTEGTQFDTYIHARASMSTEISPLLCVLMS